MDKSVLYDLSYGLYVIGTEANGIPTGCIVNTVFQLTSEPLTIAVSLNHNNYTTECIQNKREFTVSVLTEKTEASLIGGFGFQSGRDSYKYENVEYKQIINQLPVLTEQAAGWMRCSVDQIIDVGTHVLFVAHVLDAERISKDEPMTYAYYRNVIKEKLRQTRRLIILKTMRLPELIHTNVIYANMCMREMYILCQITGYVYMRR